MGEFGFLALIGTPFTASMYPDLADILAGRHDLPGQKVTLPNLGMFTKTINYPYISYDIPVYGTIGYTATHFISTDRISVDWYDYWGPWGAGNYTYFGGDAWKANCVPLDVSFCALNKDGVRLMHAPTQSDYILSNNFLGQGSQPYWPLPAGTVYVAPPVNTWTPKEEQIGTTSGVLTGNYEARGHYWIKY